MDFSKLKTVFLLCFGFSVISFAQKSDLKRKQWTYALSGSGQVDPDSVEIEIQITLNARTDFNFQYKNGDTLLWQMISNNAGSIFLARRNVDSLIITSNVYPVIRFAFDDYPNEKLVIDIRSMIYLKEEPSSLLQDFIADPTGCLGLREKHVNTNSKETLFDSHSIIGLTKEELVALIGEPNEIDGKAKRMKRHHHRGRQRFEYFISICGEQQTGYSIGVFLDNDKVTGTVMRMHCG